MILIILYHLDKPQIITNRPIALVSVYSEACGVCVPVCVCGGGILNTPSCAQLPAMSISV